MEQELLDELYESLVLEHSRKPKNFGTLTCACHSQKGKNPSCGDQLELFIDVNNNLIKDVTLLRCPRCNKLLVTPCNGECSKCGQSKVCPTTKIMK